MVNLFVQRFCCCELKKGTIIFGGISLGVTVINIIHDMVLFYLEENTSSTHYSFGVSIVAILISCSLLYGAIKELRYFLLPWLILFGLSHAILTIYCLIFLFVIPILIPVLIVLSPLWYIWLCILSYYQTLDPRSPHYIPQTVANQEGFYPTTVVQLNQAFESEKVEIEALPGAVSV